MGKYIGHRLVARPEPDNTFWDDRTISKLRVPGFLISCRLQAVNENSRLVLSWSALLQWFTVPLYLEANKWCFSFQGGWTKPGGFILWIRLQCPCQSPVYATKYSRMRRHSVNQVPVIVPSTLLIRLLLCTYNIIFFFLSLRRGLFSTLPEKLATFPVFFFFLVFFYLIGAATHEFNS